MEYHRSHYEGKTRVKKKTSARNTTGFAGLAMRAKPKQSWLSLRLQSNIRGRGLRRTWIAFEGKGQIIKRNHRWISQFLLRGWNQDEQKKQVQMITMDLVGEWIFEARMKTVKRDERKISQIFLGHYQVFCRQLWRAIWQQENTLSEIDIGSSGLYLYGGKHTHATVYCHAPTYISWTLAYVV